MFSFNCFMVLCSPLNAFYGCFFPPFLYFHDTVTDVCARVRPCICFVCFPFLRLPHLPLSMLMLINFCFLLSILHEPSRKVKRKEKKNIPSACWADLIDISLAYDQLSFRHLSDWNLIFSGFVFNLAHLSNVC